MHTCKLQGIYFAKGPGKTTATGRIRVRDGWFFHCKGTGRNILWKLKALAEKSPTQGCSQGEIPVYLPIVCFLLLLESLLALNSEILDTGFFFFNSLDDSSLQPKLRIIAQLQRSAASVWQREKEKMFVSVTNVNFGKAWLSMNFNPVK